jgi:hypothetical protein
MKILLKYTVIILVFVSCGNRGNKAPENIIQKDVMVEVITEIELTQALLKLKIANQDTINQNQLFEEVYDESDISEEEFNNSLVFYSKEPKLLEEMYIKVINNISKEQAELQK